MLDIIPECNIKVVNYLDVTSTMAQTNLAKNLMMK